MIKPALLVFDGVCVLCNNSVRFILKHENNTLIQFVPLQSEAANYFIEDYKLPGNEDSVIFVTHQQYFLRSDVLIAVSKYLKFPWSLVSIIRIIPRPIRDGIYNRIARTRYRVWGKYASCTLPEEDNLERIVSTLTEAKALKEMLRLN